MILRYILFGFLFLAGFSAGAQSVEDIIRASREFSLKGDLENAILVLKNGLNTYPDNSEIRQELAMSYYTGKKGSQAIETIKPVIESGSGDETAYQVAGIIYKGENQKKEAEKVYKEGLKRFPKSGMLYHEYGLLAESMEPGRGEGLKLWEKGIEVNPGYAMNYYEACRYLYASNNTIWTLLYGEIFVNLDSYSSRTIEIKNILFYFYKKMFTYGFGNLNEKNPFEKAVAENFSTLENMAKMGLNPESLSAIRTRFILNWFNNPMHEKYPFRLFERHQQMLRDGLFDAYNQWLFGGVANMANFQNWTQSHSEEYQAFTKFQRQQLFVINQNQSYRQ
ncbi:MAG: hypothetical protein MUE71_05770 [Chitinophagaceae bacterium]|jgi:tetratricopeptide (TPR) repeat protein|nr:hypothetical protein [Chitinophagaceae bacterium]MCU0404306.1 hypothetical protein [Chitinophagaceae bacterium]